MIQNAQTRAGVSLSGPWQTIIDPYNSGYLNYHEQPLANGGFGANRKPASARDLIEYSFDTSDRLQVPGDWNTQRAELMFYEGHIWYKRDFDYRLTAGRRVFVWFGAASQRHGFLERNQVGEHDGAYTPFQFEITKLLREKGNFLVVSVDNERRREAVPALMTDW